MHNKIVNTAGVSDNADMLLKQIQQSLIMENIFRSRYATARGQRLYHRHFSPTAVRRKKKHRLATRASKQRNR